MERLLFEPLDTLFFRDGRPFNQGEGNAGVESLFPPSPMTMVGAARAAWATALGWPGKGKWTETIATDLGGDEKELKDLRFWGPLLYRGDEPVFPVPALLVGKQDGNGKPGSIVRLRPADPKMICDLGEVCLPAPAIQDGSDAEGIGPLQDWWLSKSGIESVLEGNKPLKDDFIHCSELWRNEPKIGNRIDPDTGTVQEHMLYSTRHIRLNDNVRLVMGIKGMLDDFPAKAQVPLGGEARSCWLSKKSGGLDLPDPQVTVENEIVRYAVFVLTPLNPRRPPEPGQSFENLPGKVVSACLPRAQRWGGWDSNNFQPLPMKPHLAPGSVIFMQVEKTDRQQIINWHGKTLGERNSWGFGLIAIGQWN